MNDLTTQYKTHKAPNKYLGAGRYIELTQFSTGYFGLKEVSQERKYTLKHACWNVGHLWIVNDLRQEHANEPSYGFPLYEGQCL